MQFYTRYQKHFNILIFLLLLAGVCRSQTVGLQEYKPNNRPGYVLFAPIFSKTSYLIDKCGREVHEWDRHLTPGLSEYFLSDGNLLRTEHLVNSTFSGSGGGGGRIELLSWDDKVLWSYELSDTTQVLTHDIAPMPDGDILALVWVRKTRAEAIDLGRDPNKLDSDIWFTKIIELKPVGSDSADIVWQWNVWDHIDQDYDPTKPNYDTISKHPELVNINYLYSPKYSHPDWLHTNSIDYNPLTDQILLSVHNFNEIWVIDHSTTTAQAASHSGGKYGKGGDLLYRWGNPAAYDRGDSSDQKLFGQHDPHWIPQGLPNAGKIIIFNNGLGRPQGAYSSINIISPPVTDSNTYTLNNDSAPYLPQEASWTYTDSVPTDFYSEKLGSVQVLSNGSMLICSGYTGTFFEIDSTKNIVWKYTNPISHDSAVEQGTVPTGNAVFRCTFIEPDFPGLASEDLTPGNPLELDPLNPSICDTVSTGLDNISEKPKFSVFPNPAHNYLDIAISPFQGDLTLNVFDFEGRLLFESKIESPKFTIDLSKYPMGLYLLCIKKYGREIFFRKFIKE